MTSSVSVTMGPREWLMLLVLSVLWGSSFLFFALLVTFLLPASALLLGALVLGEAVTGRALAAIDGCLLPRRRGRASLMP